MKGPHESRGGSVGRPRRAARPLLLTPLLFALASCGYHLVGTGGTLPAGVKSVGVPMFENRTRKAEVDQRFTEQVVEELSTRSEARILSGSEGADALLKGVIMGYETIPVLLTPEGRASCYEVTVTASVRLEDLRESRTLWANDQFVFRRQYSVVSAQGDQGFEAPGCTGESVGSVSTDSISFDREIVAIEVVARQFADSMVTAILEGF